jgi:drug/metabolite transporter (DMT)-like permease
MNRAVAAARTGRWPPNVIGAGWMFLAALAFTLMTTLVKYLGADYPAALQTFYRQLAGVALLLPLMVRYRRRAFVAHRLGLMLFRSAVTVGGFILTFESFRLLPLAEANALSFTRVLWVVPIAALFLHEKIGMARLGATMIGFIGVLVMMRPDMGGIGVPHLAALGGALMLACANMSAKALTGDHEMLSLLVWSALLGVVAALPPAIADWRWPSPGDLALLGLMGAAGVAVQYCYIAGLRIGDTAAVVPVDYSRLVMAMAVGLLLFGEVPDRVTMTGAAIVVAATLFIIWREQWVSGRSKAAQNASGEDIEIG